MSVIVDRFKLIDSMIGTNVYDRGDRCVGDYIRIDDAKRTTKRIISKTDKPLQHRELMFLTNQSDEMMEKVMDYIGSKEEVNNLLNHRNWIGLTPLIDSELKLRAFDIMLKDYNMVSDIKLLMKHIDNEEDLERLEKLVNLSIENNYKLMYSSGVYFDEYEMEQIFLNKNIMSLDSEDIKTVLFRLMRTFQKGMDIKDINSDVVDILKNPLSKYIESINDRQLELAGMYNEILGEERISLILEYKYSTYKFTEESIGILKSIKDNVEDLEKRVQLATALILYLKDFNSNEDELKLLANKIKYGSVYNGSIDIALDMAGISREIFEENDLSYSSIQVLKDMKPMVSKGCYRNIINSKKLCASLYKVNMVLLKDLVNITELGQYNEEQMLKLYEHMRYNVYNLRKVISKCNIDYKLSFDELELIINNIDYISTDFLMSIKKLKQTQRLLKIKDKIEVYNTIESENFVVSDSDVEEFVNNNDVKSLMKRENPLRLESIKDFIEYSIINNSVRVNTMEELSKVKFACKSLKIRDLADLDLNEIEDKIWESKDIKHLMDLLDLSDEFKTEYRANIIKFCLSEDFNLVNSYLNNYHVKATQKRGILLITKAIMAGKYDELKFVKDDIKKEISIDISDEAFECWKRTDEVSRDSYVIKDSSDFTTIMRMGEIPVRSCMNYVDGIYSYCLLSNFDTSKKMITIHKNGKYVGRAILRLTVMTDNNADETHLDFIDFDKQEESKVDSSKELIIFLEKVYTTLDFNDFKEAYSMIIELLKSKAEVMGAKVVASRNYSSYVERDTTNKCSNEYKYVLITASKNGAQYLDSFDGKTSDAFCYKSSNVYVY